MVLLASATGRRWKPHCRRSVLLLIVSAQARPIDDVATWLQFGHFACWVASPDGYDGCCGWEYGPQGNTECWVADPLSYEKCCLERWRLCDMQSPAKGGATDLHQQGKDAFATLAELFYVRCAEAQAYLNEARSVAERVAWHASTDTESRMEAVDGLNRLRHLHREQQAALLAFPVASAWKGAPTFLKLLERWPPPEVGSVLDTLAASEPSSDFKQTLLAFLEHVFEQVLGFRDALLDALYADELEAVSRGCGEVCDTSKSLAGTSPLAKHIDCNATLTSVVFQTQTIPRSPPPSIPEILRRQFTMNSQVPVISHSAIREALGFSNGQLPQQQPPNPQWLWSDTVISALIKRAQNSTLAPGPTSLERVKSIANVLGNLPVSIKTQAWAVWGEPKHIEWWSPWMEALLLSFGAKKVVSIVPNPDRYLTDSPHDRLTAITMEQAVNDAPFDGFVLMGLATAGTGRHGDRLNPFADLQQAAAAWCMLRAGGFVLAPPMSDVDLLRWPAGRVYGPLRWPHLSANFQLLHMDSAVSVLQKAADS